jgi:hypothetical protein
VKHAGHLLSVGLQLVEGVDRDSGVLGNGADVLIGNFGLTFRPFPATRKR